MRVFLAGGTGVVGAHLIPMLTAAGHEVTATTRSQAKFGQLRALGAAPAAADGLDAAGVREAVLAASPQVVIHQMTALASMGSLRNYDKEFAGTNQLRAAGTDNLLSAARAAGATRFIAQSFFTMATYGDWPGLRGDSRDEGGAGPRPPASMLTTLRAMKHLEDAVTAFPGGLVLRYGGFYGGGASRDLLAPVRKRQLPVVGDGAGTWSFTHIEDAAAATAAAVTRGAPGMYDVVDDDPAPVATWLPYLAGCLGAKPPRHAPVWLGRLLAGEAVVAMMTEIRGAPNEASKRELGWSPRYPSWRDGFPAWAGEAHLTKAA